MSEFLLQLGFDSLFFARIDYQDRAKRLNDKSLEIVWRGSKSLASSSQVREGHDVYTHSKCSTREFTTCFMRSTLMIFYVLFRLVLQISYADIHWDIP